MAETAPIVVIDMQEGRYWGDCPMCGEEKRLDHAVGWYEEAVHEEIGAILPHGGEVGGKCVCRECHDRHYAPGAATMTAPTPTAALTPEELAAELDRSAEILGHGTGALMRGAAHMIRAQKLHTDRVDNKLVEQAAEIERLTKERDELRARDLSWSKTFQRIEVEANEDVRKLATSLERERVMREALSKPGVILFLDGRNEHGTHVLPMPMQTADITTNGDDLHEDAEAITQAAEAVGYPVGSGVWCEFRKVKGQYDDLGQCEMEPGWEFVGINLIMTEMFGWHADAALQQQETADGR